MSTSQREDDEEWELVKDDDFVYKRKKRRLLDPTTSVAPPPPPDPVVEQRHRPRRKKNALLKLKDKYLKEIQQWELLSNAVKEMQENANMEAQKRREVDSTSCFDEPSRSNQPMVQSNRRLIDELLTLAEGEEAMIRDASKLCDLAEALCGAQEERLKQQFSELPIWEYSPGELMKALSEQ